MAFWLISVLLCLVQSLAYRNYSINNGCVLGATQNPLLTLSQGIQIHSSTSSLQKCKWRHRKGRFLPPSHS